MNWWLSVPGTKAEREILLIAHIDTRVRDVMDSTTVAPGTDDDGSGLACLLETVRILSGIPLEFSIPLSKDNYYFAIRAVSPEGYPGLPAVAR